MELKITGINQRLNFISGSVESSIELTLDNQDVYSMEITDEQFEILTNLVYAVFNNTQQDVKDTFADKWGNVPISEKNIEQM